MILVFGLFGLIVGSFLNVVILRFGEKPLTGRSVCMSCGRKIAWFDLVPVFSWIMLGGACRRCGARISIQYPLVELATGILFAVVGGAPLPPVLQLLALPIAALLVAMFVYDLRHMLIPDLWAYLCAGLAFTGALCMGHDVSILIAGFVTALPLFLLHVISRGEWMGLGDAKLALSFGWLLGWFDGLYAVFLSFIIGAIVSLLLLGFSSLPVQRLLARVTHKTLSPTEAVAFTMKSEIPFGPFLILSCFIVWITHMYGIPLPLQPW